MTRILNMNKKVPCSNVSSFFVFYFESVLSFYERDHTITYPKCLVHPEHECVIDHCN